MKRMMYIFLFFALTSLAYSQFGIPEALEKKAKEKIEEAIEGEEEQEKQKEQNENTEENKQMNEPVVPKEDLKSFSKFDFIPGETVLFFDDFSQDNIGDFPAKWNTNTSGEVVTLNKYPGKWFKMKTGGAYYPEFEKALPENFTIEYDFLWSFKDAPSCFDMDIISSLPDMLLDELVPGNGGVSYNFANGTIDIRNWAQGIYGEVGSSLTNYYLNDRNGVKVRVSVAVQKQRFRLWIDDNKIFDVPRLMPKDLTFDKIRFFLWSCEGEGYQPYITNFKISVGKPDTRSKLITEGKFVTRGINFDIGSDKIKPESYGIIKDIAQVLKDNQGINVKIIGHTDGDGQAATNLTLSKKRAESVKNALVTEFGIDGSRLETDGKGASEPVSPNDTPENKANNRRVEFIKK